MDQSVHNCNLKIDKRDFSPPEVRTNLDQSEKVASFLLWPRLASLGRPQGQKVAKKSIFDFFWVIHERVEKKV